MRQAFYIIGQYKDNHSILRRNYMMKRCLILVMSFFMLAGCTNFFGKEEVFEHISVLEQSFKEKELYWKKLQTDAEKLKKNYQSNKWKIQLLGDEDEYETLNESINKLIIAIEEKDQTQSKLELAIIKVIAEDIYSL